MADELLRYYERELSYLRKIGAEFAEKHPDVALGLSLEADKCADPHVERLIQACAFLTARVQHKIDDEFPEITDSLLSILYPHYLAPIPSMSIIQFDFDERGAKVTTGHKIDKDSTIYFDSVVSDGCRFRTCYPVTLWPIKVTAARYDDPERLGSTEKAACLIRLELQCLGGTTFKELNADHIRFFLNGERSVVYKLYELLFNNMLEVRIRSRNGPTPPATTILPAGCIRPVGFGQEEGLLPYTPRSFAGYRLLQEYFTFPEKYLFFDLTEIDRACQPEFGDHIEILILLDQGPQVEQRSIDANTFRLGCTPMINLFERIAEPIRLDHTQTEYRVVPDIHRQSTTEVYSIDAVTCTSPYLEEAIEIPPAYSIQHVAESKGSGVYWFASRQSAMKKRYEGTEIYISLVNLDFRPTLPPADTLTIRTTCTNRDLPYQLRLRGGLGELSLDGSAPYKSIQCLIKPTESLRASLKREAQWRLISQLSLNYLSLCDGGRDALREILRLYNFADSRAAEQQILGITKVTSKRVVTRPPSMPWNGFCRGTEVDIEFDEEKLGNSVFLFASVLEHFFGWYASVNSFVRLIATTRQREVPLKQWQPRAGEQILL
jgi:type VI secretion system protein ImpG